MDLIPVIRTSPHTARRADLHEDANAHEVRLVAKVLRDLLRQQTFMDLTDVTEALKCLCARLKIRGYSRLVPRACDLVASNRPLVSPAPRRPPDPVRSDVRPLSRTEAAAISLRLGCAIKTLPRTSSGHLNIDGPVRDVIDLESQIAGGR